MADDPLRYRSPELVHELLVAVYTAETPIPWENLVDAHTDADRAWRTVEATIYDLVAFGALHKIGKPAQRGRPDTRALKPTPLGRSWLRQELRPLPGDS